MLNAANRQPEEIVELPHPFCVASRQIIVHRHQVRATASERVQVKRQSRNQSFAFAGRHFRDPATMQNDSAKELHVEVHHVPRHWLIAHREAILSIFQSARRVFYDCKRLRQNLIQLFPLVFQLGNFRQFCFPGCRFCAQILIG